MSRDIPTEACEAYLKLNEFWGWLNENQQHLFEYMGGNTVATTLNGVNRLLDYAAQDVGKAYMEGQFDNENDGIDIEGAGSPGGGCRPRAPTGERKQ